MAALKNYINLSSMKRYLQVDTIHKTHWVSKRYSKPNTKHHEYQPQSKNKQSIKTILETKDKISWISNSIIKQTKYQNDTWNQPVPITVTKGLGAFYTSRIGQQPKPDTAFSISLPSYIARAREHINTKEMRAVEQALLYWGRWWRGSKVILHVDNRAVAHSLKNQTLRGAPMDVLRRCLLLAAEYDLDLEARWIPTRVKAIADALSRFDYDRIANVASQLIYPTCNLRIFVPCLSHVFICFALSPKGEAN